MSYGRQAVPLRRSLHRAEGSQTMKSKTHETHVNGSPRECIKEILNGSGVSSIV